MPTHWTYDDFEADSDLEQGDLIKPSRELRGILEQFHSYFSDEKYSLFLVSTQSCDLVRRKGDPKASYITIAAVRTLRQVASRLVGEIVPSVSRGIYRRSGREQWREFLTRLFNQNEQALGLFYLHKDSDAGVDEESIAYLRVTVALKSEHYGVLLAARVGRLRADFRAKLGWLLGNLFARPATPDWSDTQQTTERLKALVSEHLDVADCKWIDNSIAEVAAARRLDLVGKTDQELEALRPKPPLEDAIDEVIRHVQSAANKIKRSAASVPPVTALAEQPGMAASSAVDRPAQREAAKGTANTTDIDELLDIVRRRLRSSEKFKSLIAI